MSGRIVRSCFSPASAVPECWVRRHPQGWLRPDSWGCPPCVSRIATERSLEASDDGRTSRAPPSWYRGHFLPRGAATVGLNADRRQRIYRWPRSSRAPRSRQVAARHTRGEARAASTRAALAGVAALAEPAHLAKPGLPAFSKASLTVPVYVSEELQLPGNDLRARQRRDHYRGAAPHRAARPVPFPCRSGGGCGRRRVDSRDPVDLQSSAPKSTRHELRAGFSSVFPNAAPGCADTGYRDQGHCEEEDRSRRGIPDVRDASLQWSTSWQWPPLRRWRRTIPPRSKANGSRATSSSTPARWWRSCGCTTRRSAIRPGCRSWCCMAPAARRQACWRRPSPANCSVRASRSMRRNITSSFPTRWATAKAPSPPTASRPNSRTMIMPTWSMRSIACSPKGSASAMCVSSSAIRWAAWMSGCGASAIPDFMDALVPMASQPTAMAARNWMLRRMMLETIRSDPEYDDGNYTSQPRSLKLASSFFGIATAGGTLNYQKLAPTRALADKFVDARLAAPMTADANDFSVAVGCVRRLRRRAGAGEDRGLIARDQCRRWRAQSAGNRRHRARLKEVKHGKLYLIPASDETRGHATTGNAKFYAPQLEELLRSAPSQRTMWERGRVGDAARHFAPHQFSHAAAGACFLSVHPHRTARA